MKKVGVEFTVLNKMGSGIGSVTRDINRLQGTIRSIGRATGAVVSLYGIQSAIRGVAGAAMEQETAEKKLYAALQLTNDATTSNMEAAEAYASQIQQLTTYGDEQVMTVMAYAKSLGVSTSELTKATKAAIGFAEANEMELSSAMRIVALASQGETSQLKRMGIIIDQNLSKQEKWNEILRQGTEKFAIAEQNAKTTAGAMQQLDNAWGDLKETLAIGVLPLVNDFIRGLDRIVTASQTAASAVGDLFAEGMPASMLDAARAEYRQVTGDFAAFTRAKDEFGYGAAGRAPAQYPEKWSQIYGQYRQQWREKNLSDMTGTGTDGASAMDDATQKAIDRVTQMNQALLDQQLILEGTAQGETHAADQLKFLTAAGEAYGDDVAKQIELLGQYNAEWAKIDQLKRDAALGDYMAGMQQEVDVLKLLADGRKAEAEQLKIVNDLKKQGIELTDKESRALSDLIDQQRQLTEQLQQQQERSQYWAQMLQTGVDGVADAISRALFYSEDLEDSFKRLLQSMASQYFSNLLSSGFGSFMNWVGGASVGSGTGDISSGIPDTVYAHSGGVPRWDAMPTVTASTDSFASAKRYHTGLQPGERPAIIRDDEGIFTPGQMRALGLGSSKQAPKVSIQVVNNGTSKSATAGEPQWDGQQWVTSVFLEDMEYGGPIRQRMEQFR